MKKCVDDCLYLFSSNNSLILGGGVLNRPSLLPKVRAHFLSLMNGYVVHPSLAAGPEGVDKYITQPHW